MRFVFTSFRWVACLVSGAVWIGAAPAAAGIFFVPTVVTDADPDALRPGDSVEVRIHAETDTPEALALGLRALFDDDVLSAGSVVTSPSLFSFAPTVAGSFNNSGNGLAGLISPSTADLRANVNLFQGVGTSAPIGTGALEGDQFSVTFTVLAGAPVGPTTIDIGAFAEFGDLYAGGDNGHWPGQVILTIVPEPAPALLLGLGLAGLGARRPRAAVAA